MKRILFFLGLFLISLISLGQSSNVVKANEGRIDVFKGFKLNYITFLNDVRITKNILLSDTLFFKDGTFQVTAASYDTTTNWIPCVISFANLVDVSCASVADSLKSYIAASTAGGWTENYIYRCNGTSFVEYIPQIGNEVTVIDSGAVFMFNGTDWVNTSSTGSPWSKINADIFNNNLGNVGIGTNAPLYKLDVNGTFRALNNAIIGDSLFVSGDTITGALDLTDIGNTDLSNSTNPLNTVYQKAISVEEGVNATMGISTLVSGTKSILTTEVTVNSRIFLTLQNCSNCGYLWITNVVAGTSFDIQSSNVLDGSKVAWIIIEPN